MSKEGEFRERMDNLFRTTWILRDNIIDLLPQNYCLVDVDSDPDEAMWYNRRTIIEWLDEARKEFSDAFGLPFGPARDTKLRELVSKWLGNGKKK